jgi:hypothetical protein
MVTMRHKRVVASPGPNPLLSYAIVSAILLDPIQVVDSNMTEQYTMVERERNDKEVVVGIKGWMNLM